MMRDGTPPGTEVDARELTLLLDRAGDRLLANAQRETSSGLPAPIAAALAQQRASHRSSFRFILPLAAAAALLIAAGLAWVAMNPMVPGAGVTSSGSNTKVTQVPKQGEASERDPVRVLESMERAEAAALLSSPTSAQPIAGNGFAPQDAWRGKRIEP